MCFVSLPIFIPLFFGGKQFRFILDPPPSFLAALKPPKKHHPSHTQSSPKKKTKKPTGPAAQVFFVAPKNAGAQDDEKDQPTQTTSATSKESQPTNPTNHEGRWGMGEGPKTSIYRGETTKGPFIGDITLFITSKGSILQETDGISPFFFPGITLECEFSR